ncbi:hypothetical protein [Paenibacillus massiliensis]|uniref:hypothetical protein n=1 Tax=Paenibacillus massiliensis TaxID=225917 RepID=UPI00046E594A|nr:hypothetical protein [Paenibacillus massiliensis]
MKEIKDSFNHNNNSTINSTINLISDSRIAFGYLIDLKEVTLKRINEIISLLIRMSWEASDVKHITWGIDEKERYWFLSGIQPRLDLLLGKLKDSIPDIKVYSPILEVHINDFIIIVNNWYSNFKIHSLINNDYEHQIAVRKAYFKERRDIIENFFDEKIQYFEQK